MLLPQVEASISWCRLKHILFLKYYSEKKEMNMVKSIFLMPTFHFEGTHGTISLLEVTWSAGLHFFLQFSETPAGCSHALFYVFSQNMLFGSHPSFSYCSLSSVLPLDLGGDYFRIALFSPGWDGLLHLSDVQSGQQETNIVAFAKSQAQSQTLRPCEQVNEIITVIRSIL